MNRTALTEYDYARLSSLAQAVSHGTKPQAAAILSNRLHDALIWKEEELPELFVRMESTAVLRETSSGEVFVYRLVFPGEANISEGRISILSPCGAALLGRREGETFSYESPGGTVTMCVEKILYEGR